MTDHPTPQPRQGTSTWLWIGAALVVIAGTALGMLASAKLFNQPDRVATPLELRAGTWVPNGRTIPDFELTDQDGEPLTRNDINGNWTFLSFGYTSCPDVCPTALATLAAMEKRLQELQSAATPRVLFISVDPERDSTERLKEYIRYFDPDFLAATGDHAMLQSLSLPLGVIYAKVDDQSSAMGYLVDHSAQILLLDPQARLSALFSAPHNADDLAQDFLTLAGHIAATD